MKKFFSLLLLLLSICTVSHAQKFEIRDGAFMLNDTPIRIYGGEMHYARIPREYWRQRIQMAKAMGCNALSIYVFWNYHETAPGVWDWTTDNHDLRAFVETARSEGMYIILRPGPYVCAEWDFGGFPYWIMNSKFRADDETFLHLCRNYLRQVHQQVDGLFVEQGGNILMTQVENEFGSFAFDMQSKIPIKSAKLYMEKMADIFREVGFTHTLFTCDGGVVPVVNFARLGHIKGLFPGTNDSKFLGIAHHTVRRFYNKKGPYYIPEEYPGWFTHWGDAHMFHRNVSTYKTHIEKLLKTDFSFCYYMIHGGTNFGFMNGANYSKGHEVWPVVTSYDYGAPVDEAGNRTPLYDSLRAVYQRATHRMLPDVPAPIPSMSIDNIKLTSYPLFRTLQRVHPDYVRDALSFEVYAHAYGYMLYERTWDSAQHAHMSTAGIKDYSTIYINDSLVATINRDAPAGSIPKEITLDLRKNDTLRILSENIGRINFGRKMYENSKGTSKGIVMDGKIILGWTIDALPPQDPHVYACEQEYIPHIPVYYTGTFKLTHTADTYINMKGFGKGVVFVNGHNLGRYWEIGPQYSLYVPGVWLNEGENEIVIFDQINHSQQHSISATAKPVNN
jgi:beta-galactosidase